MEKLMADIGPVSESTFDASQNWRDQKAQEEAQFVSGLIAPNPHTMDMNLPVGLMEDGAA
jgi:hypothetical protein